MAWVDESCYTKGNRDDGHEMDVDILFESGSTIQADSREQPKPSQDLVKVRIGGMRAGRRVSAEVSGIGRRSEGNTSVREEEVEECES